MGFNIRNKIIPAGFKNLTEAEKKKICNGFGSKKGLKFPSTFYGLNMLSCADYHDYGYEKGRTSFEKFITDALFLWNMYEEIERKSNWIMKPLRKRRARVYCKPVVFAGDSSFYLKEKSNLGEEPKFKGWNSWIREWKYNRRLWLLIGEFVKIKNVTQGNHRIMLSGLYS